MNNETWRSIAEIIMCLGNEDTKEKVVSYSDRKIRCLIRKEVVAKFFFCEINKRIVVVLSH